VLLSGRKSGKKSYLQKASENVKEAVWQQLAVNYPSAQIFESVEEMRKAFPLDNT
jgi:hypothetical protein